jgi:hypothetical protein
MHDVCLLAILCKCSFYHSPKKEKKKKLPKMMMMMMMMLMRAFSGTFSQTFVIVRLLGLFAHIALCRMFGKMDKDNRCTAAFEL